MEAVLHLYLPSVKLAKKIRVGARIKRVYEEAKTPLDRLLESGKGDAAKVEALRKLREKTDPFELSAAVNKKLAVIWDLASRAKLGLANPSKTARRKPFWEQAGEYQLPNLFKPLSNLAINQIRAGWCKERRLNGN